MGLDQYLYATKYISNYDFEMNKNKDAFLQVLEAVKLPESAISSASPHLEVQVCIGYWRKANQVHGWFVTNAQDGRDDCGTYFVSRHQLTELLALAQSILLAPALAESSLPPQAGFFFGSVEVDDWYFADLKDTVKIIEAALAMDEDWSFRYSSSW